MYKLESGAQFRGQTAMNNKFEFIHKGKEKAFPLESACVLFTGRRLNCVIIINYLEFFPHSVIIVWLLFRNGLEKAAVNYVYAFVKSNSSP